MIGRRIQHVAGQDSNIPSGREVKLILTNFSERDAVIVKDGDHVTFVTAVMAVDKPYVFPFLGKWRVAVKREDGSMDVYAVPDTYRPMLKRLSRWLRGKR